VIINSAVPYCMLSGIVNLLSRVSWVGLGCSLFIAMELWYVYVAPPELMIGLVALASYGLVRFWLTLGKPGGPTRRT
jgi:hypothetical protein